MTINRFGASLTYDARGVINDRHMLMVPATGHTTNLYACEEKQSIFFWPAVSDEAKGFKVFRPCHVSRRAHSVAVWQHWSGKKMKMRNYIEGKRKLTWPFSAQRQRISTPHLISAPPRLLALGGSRNPHTFDRKWLRWFTRTPILTKQSMLMDMFHPICVAIG